MKNTKAVITRLGSVIYFLVIFCGLVIAGFAFYYRMPKTLTNYRELVHCTNGKNFYVDSKPIYPNDGYSQYNAPENVREREITSECQFGTAYYIGWSVNLDMNNHTEQSVPQYQKVGDWSNAIWHFVRDFAIFFLIAEILKRILRYIFFGKSVFSLK